MTREKTLEKPEPTPESPTEPPAEPTTPDPGAGQQPENPETGEEGA